MQTHFEKKTSGRRLLSAKRRMGVPGISMSTNTSNNATQTGRGIAFQRPDAPQGPDGDSATLTELFPGHNLYNGIKTDFEGVGLRVTKIETVENPVLFRRFQNERDQILQERKRMDPNFDLNERYLYHGTNGDKGIFTEEELDNRLSNKGCFGQGIYFSDSPRKCARYAERGSGESLILLMRVILGEAKVYPPGKTERLLKREPKKEKAGRGNRFYDSVEGTPTNFKEFVIYERRRALVECIITFSSSSALPSTNEPVQPVVSPSPPPISTSDIEIVIPKEPCLDQEAEDSDSSASDHKLTYKDETSSEDDGDFTDAEDGNAQGEDTESGEDYDDFQDATEVAPTPQISTEELQKKIRGFMTKTEEESEYIARLYIILENYDVESAVEQYSSFIEEEFTEAEEAEMDRLSEELKTQVCQEDHTEEELAAMSEQDRHAVLGELVAQFCQVVGLDEKKDADLTKAKEWLTVSKWETDLAVIAFMEDLYGI